MNIFSIIFRSLGLYLKNLFLMFKVMLFPVWGQVIGIYLIFAATYYYSKQVFALAKINPFFTNTFILLFILVLLVIPGFAIFLRAFWDYLIKMVSLNSLMHTLLKGKTVKDLYMYDEPVNIRSSTYILLLGSISLIWLVMFALPGIVYLIPMDSGAQVLAFWGFEALALVLLGIFSVYLSLSFQVFAFEENLCAVDTLKKSVSLVKGHFWTFVFLALGLGLIMGVALLYGVVYLFSKFEYAPYLSAPVEVLLRTVFTDTNALAPLAGALNSNTDMFFELSNAITEMILTTVITAFLLPFSTACYTQAYGAVCSQKRNDERAVEAYKKRAKPKKSSRSRKKSYDED